MTQILNKAGQADICFLKNDLLCDILRADNMAAPLLLQVVVVYYHPDSRRSLLAL
jgi:hypothetical protein